MTDPFRTFVHVEEQKEKMTYSAHLLFMGSCFATNIGNYFSETGFNALVNPFGVLYNPISIAKALNRLMVEIPYTKDDLHLHNDLWQSFDHHSSFSHVDRDKCLEGINQSLSRGADFLKSTRYLFITFGTSWVYELKDNQQVVSNCHKYPASKFKRFLTTQKQIVELYQPLISTLKEMNPDLKIILTVSPVRHWKDGAHGNQISKSILHLAIEELRKQHKRIYYFPAYELLLDELRDYRFFDDDMLHPSPLAIQFIRSKFIQAWLNEKCHHFIKDMEQIKKAANHRPFNIHSDQHQKFVTKYLDQLKKIEKYYPDVNLTSFFTIFRNQLKNSDNF